MEPIDQPPVVTPTDAASNPIETKPERRVNETESLVIMLQDAKVEEDKKNIDFDKEEMERAIVNINRKTRPLIKHVNVGNNHILHIDVNVRDVKSDKASREPLRDDQVASWEDLFNEEDDINEVIEQVNANSKLPRPISAL